MRSAKQVRIDIASKEMQIRIGNTALKLMRADITLQDTEAIVNAANSGLLGGGGVDGAIHRAGGARILEECKAIRATEGECPTGNAVITSGGKLKARYVIHTVGPVWSGGTGGEDQLLRSAYQNSLLVAEKHNIRSISFPSISTGIYGFPIERASRIAVETVKEFVKHHQSIQEVRFIVFSESDFDVYNRLFAA